MDRPTALAFRLGRHAPRGYAVLARLPRWQTRRDPERAGERFTRLRPAADRDVIRRPNVWATLVASLPDVSPSPRAAAHEFALMARPWGFDPIEITVPTHVWAGEADTVHPPHHAAWLAARIPDATLEVRADVAIFGFLDDYPRLLATLACRR